MKSTSFDINVTMLPEYCGWWFYPIDRGNMKRVNLSTFYKFSAAMYEIGVLEEGDKINHPATIQLVIKTRVWLLFFLGETDDITFPHSREIAESLHALLGEVMEKLKGVGESDAKDDSAQLDKIFIMRLKQTIDEFERFFTRESRRVSVFAITSKGIYDTEKLIESAEKRFPKNLLKVMPEKTISDLRESGRCLAFENPTACAFHVCRATEALMLAYYEVLAGQAWPFNRRDWNMYNEHLKKHGAPQAITNRLGEIREDRNAYAHPDITVPLDEALLVFELCNGVIHLMAKEIEKLEAAKTAASSSPPSTP
ncbi:MAG TPA: DUF4145 domain-containing protein [Pyrinomonadaceae bacterium]|jgi:hypothetical protein|nr:DUF4145 domain-containing protein [Pyrinomonadaceae bacterium]